MQPRIPEVTLLEEVGRGPGSVVFRALHQGSGCTVKLPSDRPSAVASRSSEFEQDQLQLARLSRAGLARVLQVGASDDTSYAILDESDGEPLTSVLRGPILEHDALRFALNLTSCLRELHDAGFVHGSLTPEHILLSTDGARVTLLDHGSVTRPVTFEPRVDTEALGVLLRACAHRIEQPGAGASALLRLAEELALSERCDLTSVIAELDARVSLGRKRRSAYPAPSAESLAALPPPPMPITLAARPTRSEIAQLRRLWERAAAEHRGAIVGVLGAAGSGKSRLLATFADGLSESNVQVLSVRCRNSDWAPFSALKRLLDGHLAGLAALEPERRARVEAILREAAGPLASRARLLSPRLAELFRDAPVAIPEGDAQQVFLAGMADFLSKYLEWSGRSVVVIDDVHWLDASSRIVLSNVAARLCPQGHIFVCGARDDAESREPLERFRAALLPQFVETVRLGSLIAEDASQVIGEYLGLERPASELVEQLTQLSDGTPLSLLELLRSMIERGMLKLVSGRWQLDTAQVQRMRLPASSRALIARRLSEQDPAALAVLRAAAVVRNQIELPLVARVTELPEAYVQSLFDRAVAARLIELDPAGTYGFVHDTVWESLLGGLDLDAKRALHQRVADTLFLEGGSGVDYEYDLARHHAEGIVEQNPARVFETNRAAARRALQACDDALAMTFLQAAERAAPLAGLDPGRALFVQLAETHLRTGDTRESLRYFERALVCSRPGSERAHVRGRIAWIHHYESNAAACRHALEAALADSGARFPGDHAGGFLLAAAGWAASSIRSAWLRRRGRPNPPKRSQQEAQALCELYSECFRVSLDSGSPFGVMSSVLAMARDSQGLEPCRPVVHSELLMSFFYATLGLDKKAHERFARAENIARELGDPIAQTLVHAVHHAISGWRGDFEESGRQARMCVDDRGHWMEIGELCLVCFAMYGIDIARGRPEAALAWIDRAIERVRQNGRAPAMFSLLEDAAKSTLVALGREREVRNLERRLRFVERTPLQHDGFFHMLSYQSRVQRFTESGDLGPEFEALVASFDQLGLDPRRVHLLVAVYYQHVAHARVHQCLRADPAERAPLLPKLERAVRDVERATRLPSMKSHSFALRAAERWFSGRVAEAKSLLAKAERLAEDYSVPSASYATARLRAHMLRAEGKESAARDQARIASMWAQQYGQFSRLRFICEEFDLQDVARSNPGVSNDVEQPSSQRNLDALLRVSHANSRELGPERQATLILDELLEALGAERAFLFMRGEDLQSKGEGALALVAARRAGSGELDGTAKYDRGLVDRVYATGQTQLSEVTEGDRPGAERACIGVALVLREQAFGVLYLDRPELEGSFCGEDSALLQALANQVALALELGSSLRERERLQQNLQQAQTMEAVGRLAGGIAHDFNNILAAIQYAASSLAGLADIHDAGREELDDIQTAARRGADLTRQLLGLSRGKTLPPPPRRIMLGDAVRDLLPMLRRLVRNDVQIAVDIAAEPLATMADLSQIERVLVNLGQNASDAMPQGGTITIRVAPLEIDDVSGQADSAGTSHVLLAVSDTGTGMNDEVRTRLFEPFFTTKNQRGTGLGLANVYTIVQQCRGAIEVVSELGAGSTFRITLARCPSSDPVHGVRFLSEVRPASNAAPGSPVVLVVDDDEAVRRMVCRTLELGGYRVTPAPDAESALRIVDGQSRRFDLIVTDMHMPGMDGSHMARLLYERDPKAKLLFLSGDDSDDLEELGLLSRDAAFLHKPFRPDMLIAHVRKILSAREPAALRDSG